MRLRPDSDNLADAPRQVNVAGLPESARCCRRRETLRDDTAETVVSVDVVSGCDDGFSPSRDRWSRRNDFSPSRDRWSRRNDCEGWSVLGPGATTGRGIVRRGQRLLQHWVDSRPSASMEAERASQHQHPAGSPDRLPNGRRPCVLRHECGIYPLCGGSPPDPPPPGASSACCDGLPDCVPGRGAFGPDDRRGCGIVIGLRPARISGT
jgi:hypothetical protein